MTEWTMNTAQLEKGMLIRRPGLDESLEVVNVRNGQAKIKLPGGKTSTIPASAEVEWNWPETKATRKPEIVPEDKPEPDETIEPDTDWLTDWSLLDVGIKIEVLGEPGDFTILRLNDSSARIKHNATGQIQPLSIGHKFKIVEVPVFTKPAKAKPAAKTKSKASKKPEPVPEPEPVDLPFEEPDQEPDHLAIDDNEPSDEALAAIENGDDETEIDDTGDIDPASLDDLDDTDEADTDDLEDNGTDDNDNDPDTEDDDMPAPAPKKSPRSASGELLTVGQIAERTGISYPTLMRYIKDHGDRLPSEGEGRKRRFLPEAIEVFRQIRSETKGGRPSSGKSAHPSKPRSDKGTKRAETTERSDRSNRPERSHETAAPYAAPINSQSKARSGQAVSSRAVSVSVTSGSSTIDQALGSAIEHAQAQIEVLQSLIDDLETQRERIRLWS